VSGHLDQHTGEMFKEAPEPLGLQDEKREGEAPGGDSEEGGASLASPHPSPGNIDKKRKQTSAEEAGGAVEAGESQEAMKQRKIEEKRKRAHMLSRSRDLYQQALQARQHRAAAAAHAMEQQQLQQALHARQQHATAAAQAMAMGQQQQQQHALQARHHHHAAAAAAAHPPSSHAAAAAPPPLLLHAMEEQLQQQMLQARYQHAAAYARAIEEEQQQQQFRTRQQLHQINLACSQGMLSSHSRVGAPTILVVPYIHTKMYIIVQQYHVTTLRLPRNP
jgi:hypothetical protein